MSYREEPINNKVENNDKALPIKSVVLVVDNDELQRSLLKLFLQLGYTCSLKKEAFTKGDLLVFGAQCHGEKATKYNQYLFSTVKKYLQNETAMGVLGFVCLDGFFGSNELINPELLSGLGLVSLLKTAHKEYPSVAFAMLDCCSRLSNEHIVSHVAHAIKEMRSGQFIEMGVNANLHRTYVEYIKTPPEPVRIPLERRDVVLVTGGARGVTAQCLIGLCQNTPLRLILIGRSALQSPDQDTKNCYDLEIIRRKVIDKYRAKKKSLKEIEAMSKAILASNEIQLTLDNLKQLGSDVRYFSGDVQNSHRLEQIVQECTQLWGPIRGIIHGAGVIHDRAIKNKELDEFGCVFATKVESMIGLMQLIPLEQLKLLVFFTSVVAKFGNKGQVDYAMANEVMNKLAWYYSKKNTTCRIKAINWGPWQGGMVNAVLQHHFEQQGISCLPMDSGVQYFVQEIMTADPHVEVIIGGFV